MKFIKNFFNDNSTIIGLCGFETRPKCLKNFDMNDFPANKFQIDKIFKTNFEKNIFV